MLCDQFILSRFKSFSVIYWTKYSFILNCSNFTLIKINVIKKYLFSTSLLWFITFYLIFKLYFFFFLVPYWVLFDLLSFKNFSFPALKPCYFRKMSENPLANPFRWSQDTFFLAFFCTLLNWSHTWNFLESGSSWFLWDFLFSQIKIEKHLRKETWSVWTTL